MTYVDTLNAETATPLAPKYRLSAHIARIGTRKLEKTKPDNSQRKRFELSQDAMDRLAIHFGIRVGNW